MVPDWDQLNATLGAAIDEHVSVAATWNGDAARVQHFDSDEEAPYGASRAVVRRNLIQVRQALVPTAAVGDVVVLTGSGRTFKVIALPLLDADGFWVCEVSELAL